MCFRHLRITYINISLQIIPRVDNEKLPEYINSSDVYFQSSSLEGNPKALLEAMSCGSLVFCKSSNGIKEIINSGINGFLYDNDEDLRSCLFKLYGLFQNNMIHVELLKQNARAYILKNNCLRAYLRFFTGIIDDV